MKILLLDIETAPHVTYVWSLWPESINHENIVTEGYTLCWSAKFLGENKIYSGNLRDGNAPEMLAPLYSLLNEADAVVHYNGSKFDMPTLNKDFLLFSWNPPAPITQIDLLKVVRKNFKFPSNKLDYVCKKLGLGNKIKTGGLSLWKGCIDGDPESWAKMIAYNIHDVELLEALYHRLVGWIKNVPNHNLKTQGTVCPNCGSKHLHSRGYHHTKSTTYRRFVCKSCGKWSRSRLTDKVIIKPEVVSI